MPTTITPHWLYRVAAVAIDVNHHRAIWSFTWLSTDPPTTDINTLSALNTLVNSLRFPFGFSDPINFGTAQVCNEELWPRRRILSPYNPHGVSPTAMMNPAAPEAAMRLQRVGATGSKINCGRICFPIREDTWFTDLPHRRHIDVARFQPKFNAHFPQFGNSLVVAPRTYHHVIYNRRDHTWVQVVNHVLERSTVRVWQRWRTYNPGRHRDPDAAFVPPEVQT